MQDRRIVLKRGMGLKHRRQFLVLDLDEVKSTLGDVLVVSCDGRHALATEAHPIVGQDRHVLHCPTPQSRPDIRTRDDSVDARDLPGRCSIDADDTGVRVGTMEGLAPEGAGQGYVRRIARVARRLRGAVHPGYWLSNDMIGGHVVLSAFRAGLDAGLPGYWRIKVSLSASCVPVNGHLYRPHHLAHCVSLPLQPLGDSVNQKAD